MVNAKNPLKTHLIKRQLLTKLESDRKTYLLTFDVKDVDIEFEEGDSLGVLPENDPFIVDTILAQFQLSPDSFIQSPHTGKKVGVKEYLIHEASLKKLPLELVEKVIKNSPEKALLEVEKEKKEEFLETIERNYELWDLLEEFPPESLSYEEIFSSLSPLFPRYYSIASSYKATPDVIELIVSRLSYVTDEKLRFGVTTHFLCDLVEVNKTPVKIFVQKSRHFHLPKDSKRDIIMVGPGTGIAPFRAFLQNRVYTQADGKNILFFGERYKASDFYLEDFLKELEVKGKLQLFTAFSRDQAHKIYVQDLLKEEGKRVFSTLENGGYFFVCGNGSAMAKDVEKALLDIIAKEGHLSEKEAASYLLKLKKEKRYLRDVYC